MRSALLEGWHQRLKNHPQAAQAVLALIAAFVFAGVLANGFVYDDGKQLLENPFVRNPRLWPHIFTGSVWSFLGGAVQTNFYRPLHIFTYWLVYRVAGTDPAAYHFFQWFLYMLTALVVFRVGRELLHNDLAAFVGSLLWILHPLHVEAVAWIASTPDVGCGLFYLLGFWLFLRAERAENDRHIRHVLAASAYFPALFFKEMGLSFPVLVLAYWFYFPSKDSLRGKALNYTPYVVAVAGYMGIRIAALGHLSGAAHIWKIRAEVPEAALGLLGQHAKLFFWPVHLNVFHTFDPDASLHSPWPWLTLIVLAAVCALRMRQRTFGFLIAWWAVTLLPCLDVRQLSFPLLAERFSYLPSVGLCLGLAFGGLCLLPRRLAHLEVAPAVLLTLTLIGCLWTIQTIQAIPRWRNNEILWSYSLRVAPDAALVHVHHGLELQYRDHDLTGAAREFQRALDLNRTSYMPLSIVTYDSYIGLGEIAHIQRRYEEALGYFQMAARLLPYQSLAYDYFGAVYFPSGDYVKAAEYFVQAIKVNPQDLSARFYLGTCWMKLGKYREAAEQFHAARDVDPTYFEAYLAEARALEAAGDAPGAARARSLKP